MRTTLDVRLPRAECERIGRPLLAVQVTGPARTVLCTGMRLVDCWRVYTQRGTGLLSSRVSVAESLADATPWRPQE